MIIVITDTGRIWKHDDTVFERFSNIIEIVCLNGKALAEDFKCFVSPYDLSDKRRAKLGSNDRRLTTLLSVARKLNNRFHYHEDVVFLTDMEPSTLYPFYAVKELNEYNRFHLIAIPPLYTETNTVLNWYNEMLSDLSSLTSVMIYDTNERSASFDKTKDLDEFYACIRSEIVGMLTRILNDIYKIDKSPCYFDLTSMKYVPVTDGFDKTHIRNKEKENTKIEFPLYRRSFTTLGLVIAPSYPEDDKDIKRGLEQVPPRIDGKRICNILREQRIRLAEANGIVFDSPECPSIGPCAGTCSKCDKEAAFLRKALDKIPADERIYPSFDPIEEMKR